MCMRVSIRVPLDATPEQAADMLLDPTALTEVVAPILRLDPRDGAFPVRWIPGVETRVTARALGLVPVGDQSIRIAVWDHGRTRLVEDSGRPLSGALALITSWRHRMMVSPRAGGGAEFRDRLDFSAGWLTPLVAPGLWALWRWRARGVRRAAARRAAAAI